MITFKSPPLPHYVLGGSDTYKPGRNHLARKNIGVFDLIFVVRGCLYMGEENQRWSVQAGETLILRPDRYHYSYQPCDETTNFHWIHFQTTGPWNEFNPVNPQAEKKKNSWYEPIEYFYIQLPRYCKTSDPHKINLIMKQMIALESQHSSISQWKQQEMFQQLLMSLKEEKNYTETERIRQVAERCIIFLKENYTEKINYKDLQKALHFHPAYISRCMKQMIGLTPLEYLTQYRIGNAKMLLINTDLPIEQIALKVGFNSATYFIRSFVNRENITPKVYRQQFRT